MFFQEAKLGADQALAHKCLDQLRTMFPSYSVYCIASEALAGYSGNVVLIHESVEPFLSTAPTAYGKAAPAIHIDTLGMDDFEARVLALEME